MGAQANALSHNIRLKNLSYIKFDSKSFKLNMISVYQISKIATAN